MISKRHIRTTRYTLLFHLASELFTPKNGPDPDSLGRSYVYTVLEHTVGSFLTHSFSSWGWEEHFKPEVRRSGYRSPFIVPGRTLNRSHTKIFLIRHQLTFSDQELRGITNRVCWCPLFLSVFWDEAALAVRALLNDPTWTSQLTTSPHRDLAEAAPSVLERHLRYVPQDVMELGFF